MRNENSPFHVDGALCSLAAFRLAATLGAEAGSGEAYTKLALQGALILYLDFINLFLMLLRIFGGRRRD